MEMRNWVTPEVTVQGFDPNEYVAVCWHIGCGVSGSDPVDKYNKNVTHNANSDGTGCGHSENQYIVENPNGTISITEVKTDGLGELTCNLTDSTWTNSVTIQAQDLIDFHQNNPEDDYTLYWTTSASDGRVWHHWGIIDWIIGTRPLHS